MHGQLDAQGLSRPLDDAAVHVYTRRVADALRVLRAPRASARAVTDTPALAAFRGVALRVLRAPRASARAVTDTPALAAFRGVARRLAR